ncbi:hypothetical protein SEVIR_4G027000v4 [Setaria viridis]|uniref:Uncharacterized protein n=1 Tax=Setaria viridis TaxID=4556 RepID=A0A4U6UVP8_SETVI|nr:hypothetical protein SEVIR_4G027000v2 [Setaria viridis]
MACADLGFRFSCNEIPMSQHLLDDRHQADSRRTLLPASSLRPPMPINSRKLGNISSPVPQETAPTELIARLRANKRKAEHHARTESVRTERGERGQQRGRMDKD